MPLAGGAALVAGPSIAGVLLTGLPTEVGPTPARISTAAMAGRRSLVRGGAPDRPTREGRDSVRLVPRLPEFRPDFLTSDNKLSIVVTGIVLGLMVGFFEELGWTGFAQPRLRQRHGVVTTGLVMGLLWGAWHFPMFAGTTDPTGTLPAALVVAVLLFAWLPPYRVLMVWVYERTESSSRC